MQLEGRTVLITGAARGIGLAIARAFARRDARVALADLGSLATDGWAYALSSAGDLAAATAAVAAEGAAVEAIEVDVTQAASCTAAVAATLARFGSLDVLVNNAGLLKSGLTASFAERDFDRLLAVNLKGVFLMTRAAVPALVAARGAVVNLSSVCGKAGYARVAAYSASKFAVLGFTQAVAQELAPAGVRVNAVCPGLVPTAMADHLAASGVWSALGLAAGPDDPDTRRRLESALVPLGRFQTPEEVAEAAVYLATADSVTGASLLVAGGQFMA